MLFPSGSLPLFHFVWHLKSVPPYLYVSMGSGEYVILINPSFRMNCLKFSFRKQESRKLCRKRLGKHR